MPTGVRATVALFAGFALAGPLAAQMMPMQGPTAFRGVWSPVVGAGSAYQVDTKREGKKDIEIAVVGSEDVDGNPGHWIEIVMKDNRGEQVIVKHLIVLDEKQTHPVRMIMQHGEEQPIEFSMDMMGMIRRGQPREQAADIRTTAEHVGTESVTTPAGTFTCEHYRDNKSNGDLWVTEKVAPDWSK